MAKAPAFQWYPRDYLTDEAVVRMSLEQRGAYVQLLSHQWLEGSIPADMPGLAALCGINPARMRAIWPGLAPKFQPAGDGRLRNQRLEDARQQKDKWRERQSEGGKIGAEKRWHGDGSAMGQPMGQPINDPMGSDSLAVCSLQSAVTETVSNETGAAGAAPPVENSQPDVRAWLAVFMPMLRECGFEADDTDGSILKHWHKRGYTESETEAAIRGTAALRAQGHLKAFDGCKLSLRLLYARPKPDAPPERRPLWNEATELYHRQQERSAPRNPNAGNDIASIMEKMRKDAAA